jgi:hypothetical protein
MAEGAVQVRDKLGGESMKTRFVTFALAALLLACEPSRPVAFRSARPLREITAGAASEGFVDLAFSIEAVEDRSAETAITVAGLHEGRRVELRVVVAKGMKPGVTANSIDRTAFRVDGIRLESTGPESDAFVAALATLYRLKVSGKMRSSVDFVAFPLQGHPGRIATQHLNFKVFHDPDNKAGEYCELYVHVDIPKSEVRIDEKDAGYREAVVKALRVMPAA